MKLIESVIDRLFSAAIPDAIDSLAEIASLNDGRVAAAELPVDLVEDAGPEDHGGDDAGARSGLDDSLDAAEEEGEFCFHVGEVLVLEKFHFEAILAAFAVVGGGVVVCEAPFVGRFAVGDGGEVDFVERFVEADFGCAVRCDSSSVYAIEVW